jgi:hypothetical protein
VRPNERGHTVTRKHPISISAVSLLFTLPGAAFAQSALPPPPPEAAPPAPVPAAPLTPAPSTAPAWSSASTAAPAPAAPPPDPASPGSPIQLVTLRIMREKGIITQAEYDSAARDMAESVGTQLPNQEHVVIGKWASTLYGFVEADSIYDSTRSLNDLSGNSSIARAGTLAGNNGRLQMGARNSRLGFRMKAPEYYGVRASAMIESDFLGTQLPVGTGPYAVPSATNSAFGTEAAYFTNPTFRIRHMNLKVETPVVDILFGQYWQLYGWQSAYQPNTVEIQGISGEIYSRTPQLRISKTVKAYPVTFEAAVAAVRPFQRDSATPDGEGGLRLAIDSWTGVQTVGSAGTQISPLSVAVTGLVRHVAVNSFPVNGTNTTDLTMGAVAADAFVPVIPGTKESKDNSLSLNGEFSTGYGDADMYTGLTGGVGFPAPATGSYSPDIDPGVVTFDYAGKLHGIQWTSYLMGLQYYVPGTDGKLWISGNYSRLQSANIHYYAEGTIGSASSLMHASNWFDVNLFVEPLPAVRFGVEFATTKTTYVDSIYAINHRGQLSGFFIF